MQNGRLIQTKSRALVTNDRKQMKGRSFLFRNNSKTETHTHASLMRSPKPPFKSQLKVRA